MLLHGFKMVRNDFLAIHSMLVGGDGQGGPGAGSIGAVLTLLPAMGFTADAGEVLLKQPAGALPGRAADSGFFSTTACKASWPNTHQSLIFVDRLQISWD